MSKAWLLHTSKRSHHIVSHHANLLAHSETAEIPGYDGRYIISRKGIITDRLKQRPVRVSKSGNGYLYCSLALPRESPVVPLKRRSESLHRLLAHAFLDRPDGTNQVDHLDRNPLNNSLGNLEWVSCQEQMRNRETWGCSRWKGVSWVPATQRWRASIMVYYQLTHLGDYGSEEEAAAAWNVAAVRHRYRSSQLNAVDLAA
ncbi:HNH endonuclease [Hymenobacter gelipurpurascens]|uniref:HNH endonuclease n=1 Tax=Hymenobacter gelipurpurascens TaxID=89968 RepID=UPI000B588A55